MIITKLIELLNNTKAKGEMFLYGETVLRLLVNLYTKDDPLHIVVRGMDIRTLRKHLSRIGTVGPARIYDPMYDEKLLMFTLNTTKQKVFFRMASRNGGIQDKSNTIKQDALSCCIPPYMIYTPIDRIGHMLDPLDVGLKSIRSKEVREVDQMKRRFSESPIRMLQMFSACAKYGFDINENVLKIMTSCSSGLLETKPTSMRVHLNDILLSSKPSRWLQSMHECGILEHILPELEAAFDVYQDATHDSNDVAHHCMYSCDHTPASLKLRLAALLHDIGKVPTRSVDGNRVTFHNHEVIGSRMANDLMYRLGYSKELIKQVADLVRMHMYHYTRRWSNRAVLRFIDKVGIKRGDNIPQIDLFRIRKAERMANPMKSSAPITSRQSDFETRIEEVLTTHMC